MREWWERKKEKSRFTLKKKRDYTFLDGLFDSFFWASEIILLPFRLLFWILRAFGRFIGDLIDGL